MELYRLKKEAIHSDRCQDIKTKRAVMNITAFICHIKKGMTSLPFHEPPIKENVKRHENTHTRRTST